MFANLFKPKWQHKDAKVRLKALESLKGGSPELIQLAQNDPDTGVRLEAIARLSDLNTLINLGQRDDTIGERSRTRLLTVADNDHSTDKKLLEIFSWLEQAPTLLVNIASDARRDTALRERCLPFVEDKTLLYRIAHDDNAKVIQFTAANLLNDLDQLKKLTKTHSDNKRLRQLFKDKMAQHEAEQQFLHGLEDCCTELEKLGHSQRWEQDKTQFKVLQNRWESHDQQRVPDHLVIRFNDAEKQFQQRLADWEQQQAAIQPQRERFQQLLQQQQDLLQRLQQDPSSLTLSDIDGTSKQTQQAWEAAPPIPEEEQSLLDQQYQQQTTEIQHIRNALQSDFAALDNLQLLLKQAQQFKQQKKPLQSSKILTLQSEWTAQKQPQTLRDHLPEIEAQFQQAISSLNDRLQREATAREQAAQQLEQQMSALENLMDQEQYSHAIELHHQIQQQLKQQDLPAKTSTKIKKRMQSLAPMIRELQDWRRWGTDQAREHLIEDAEHLQEETSLDPQERAKRIRAMRDEWRKLTKLDPGHQRQQWKNFDQKVSAAYEPSKQHFAEQAQKRQAHLQQREAICQQIEQLTIDTDWDAPALNWKTQHQKINHLRKQWKQAGTVSHKDWKSINERFNNAMDALDEQLKTERQRNWQQRNQLAQQAKALLDMEDIQTATEQAKTLQGQWQITIPSRQGDEQRLWKQFRQPIDELFERLKQERNQSRNEQQQQIQRKEALCSELQALADLPAEALLKSQQQQTTLSEEFQAIRGLPRAVHKKLESQWQVIQKQIQDKLNNLQRTNQLAQLNSLASKQSADAEMSVAQDDEGAQICLELELLLQLETPEAFQAERRAWQMARLSESMTSRNDASDPAQQAIKLLKQWYSLPLSAEAHAIQKIRINAAQVSIAGE